MYSLKELLNRHTNKFIVIEVESWNVQGGEKKQTLLSNGKGLEGLPDVIAVPLETS